MWSQIGLIICRQSTLNKQHNSKVPSWVTHSLVVLPRNEAFAIFTLNELSWAFNILVAINVGLWASVQFPP